MKLKIIAILVILANSVFAQNYHDTQGKLEISNGGQANFSIPIAMPPSINSIGPTINLAYISGTASGIAGQGWNINSLSSIARVSTRLDIEGYRDGVDFDQDDKLALDGQYLLLKSGNYWSPGSLYQTEVQSNVKIELQGSGTSMYFIVTAPDGARSWYGNYNGEVASDQTAFYLTRYEDTNGNLITYHYNSSFNSLFISEIRFSANINTNPVPLNKILFTYKNASRVESYFVKGIEVKRDKILDMIEVFTNNSLFKKYQLTHSVDSSGYERVSKVQEYNSNIEAANPIIFEYNQTNYTATETFRSYQGSFSPSFSHVTSGDFDGDGRLDFANANQIYLSLFSPTNTSYLNDNIVNLPITLIKDRTFPITTIQNNKLKQAQSILKIEENLGSIDFITYSLDNGIISLINSKNISINNQITLCEDNCNPPFEDINGDLIPNPNSKCADFVPTKKTAIKYLEGDFNGDSVSEMLVINFNEVKKWELLNNNGNQNIGINVDLEDGYTPLCKPSVEIVGVYEVRLIDLNPNNPSLPNTIGNFSVQSSELDFLHTSKYFIADFNGDGKSDLMAIKPDGNYKVFSFKENLELQTIGLEIIGQGINPYYNLSKQIMFGDYNGDAKTDIMLPDASGNGCIDCNYWHIFYSNPKPNQTEMFEKITLPIVQYWPSSEKYWKTINNRSQYIAMDVNKDGKTDLLRVWLNVYQPSPFWDAEDYDSEWRVEAYINNIGKNGKFDLEFSSDNHGGEDPGFPMPFVANFDYLGGGRCDKINADIAVLRWNGQIQYLDITKDFNEDNLLKKVYQSNNTIIDEISYKKLILPQFYNGLGSVGDFYSSTNEFNYPFIEFKQMSTNNVVNKLINTSGGTTKKQDFKYHGLTYDVKGIGAIGFKKVVRSNWYFLDADKKIWVETISAPLKRGAIISSITYKPNQNFSFSFSNSSNSNIFLSKREFNFEQINPPNTFPFVLQKQSEKHTDYLTNVVNETAYFYSSDGYYLENKSISKNYFSYNPASIQGKNEVITNYDNNPTGVGSNYYIGRPQEITTTKKLFVNTIPNTPADNSNTQIASEKLFYSNNNLIKSEKSSNNSTEKLVEEFAYFSNGLVQSKTASASGTTSLNAVAPVVMEYTYDPTNRFIKTTKNVNDNLTATNDTFHPVYGLVTSSTNALGQTSTSHYDNWGKRTKVTDFLGKSITYTYTRSGEIYATNEIGDDGTTSLIEQDVLAREIRKGAIDLNGNWNYVKTEYDGFGRKYRVSEPYAANASPIQWNTSEFDELSRPIKAIAHTGKIVYTNYNGLSVSATEPTMSKSKTMNALGLVISATDTPGGTILYKYDANGNLLESDYEGIKTKIQYDKWGRKERLEDTSAGIYTYNYDAFSRAKEEITPKGKTVYTYDTGGRIATKVITGLTAADATNMTATYNYHPTNKWLTNLNVVNPIDGNSTYEYSYDSATKQLNQTVEKLFTTASSTSPVATFTKSITFDAFGRVNNETSTALSYGKTSTKTITHVYKNGTEWQLKDGATIIWQANTVNSRGQLTHAQLGNGITNTNTYDTYGYLTQQKQNLGVTNIVTLSNQFDPILGNLMNRYNSLFDSNEVFEYDNLDRLVKWDGTSTNILNLPFNTTTDGFAFTGIPTQGSVSNVAGTLKVYLNAQYEPEFPIAAEKSLNLGLITDDKINIKATITNKTVNRGTTVKAIIIEEDPTDPSNFIENEISTIENGQINVDYTVSNFVTNPILKLRFVALGSWIANGASLASENGETLGTFVIPKTTFYVDNLKIDKIPTLNQDYDNKGRITQNRFGEYKYEITNKPYQNSKVKLSPNGQNYYGTNASNILDVKYNMFSSPYRISHATKDIIDLSYNITEQRSIMYWGSINPDKNLRPFRRYYSADGSMEVTVKFTNNNYVTPNSVEIITFVDGTAYDSEIVVKNTYIGSATTATGGLFYLHRDYQGSIIAITNSVGAVIEKRQYDPWGLLTKIQDGTGNNLTKLTFFDRGYTGHEHLESVGLINMNGRVYDPILHRFLQADSMVQEPYNTQNYNRYGYCLNNPLKYTDISGEDFGVTLAISLGVALVMYFGDAIINDKPITFKGIATTVVITAVSGGIAYGIGSVAAGIGNFYTRATFQALAHGLTQGGMTALAGGKFWSGFAAGSISSIMSSAWQGGESFKTNADGKRYLTDVTKGLGGVGANGTVGTMFVGTLSGGAGAALTGGNFWQGAVTGLIVSGLNHAAHGGFAKKFKFNVMLDEKGARNFGHHAISGELDNGDYRFISKNGTLDPNDANFSGKSDYTDKVFDSVGDIQEHYGTKITPGHSFNKIDTYLMTRNQMTRAFEYGLNVAKQNYHLFTNSCTNVVSAALYGAYNNSTFLGKRFIIHDPTPRLNHILQRGIYYNHYFYSK